jgi:hypothetical protein
VKRRLARTLTVVAVLVGLIIHIGLGCRLGLIIAGIAASSGTSSTCETR